MIQVGQYRSNPCQHPLRMVSVRWQGPWSRYLPTGLDPQVVSARQVGELSRRRWRIEEALALTTRLVDLA
jgi:IS4 transposase